MDDPTLSRALATLDRVIAPVPLATVEGWIVAREPRGPVAVAPPPLSRLTRLLARLGGARPN